MVNTCTIYLVKNGWIEAAPMRYQMPRTSWEIFFDNSHQIELYNNRRCVGQAYVTDVESMVLALQYFQAVK